MKKDLLRYYWKVFHLVFVTLFLCLLNDAFFRWDGFRYYASFNEFLPSVSLISILWGIVAVLTTIFVGLSINVFVFLSNRAGWKIKTEHALLLAWIYLFFELMFFINSKLKILYSIKINIKQLSIYTFDRIWQNSSFVEHLPNIVQIALFFAISISCAAFLMWLSLRMTLRFCNRMEWKIRLIPLLLFLCFFGLLTLIFYIVDNEIKIIIYYIFFICLATVFTWLFRQNAERWVNSIQMRITPLVWLFGIYVIISIPLVSYHAFFRESEHTMPKETFVSNDSRPNIILVVFDTLAAHDMSLYGYERKTTPFIDKWAKNSTVFTMAEAESNFTTSTVSSFMTGKRVWTHQTYHLDGSLPVSGNTENMPLILKEHGYFNVAFVANPSASPNMLGMTESFDIAPPSMDFGTHLSLIGRYSYIKKYLCQLFEGKIRLWDWIVKKDFMFYKLLWLISNDFSSIGAPPEKAFNSFFNNIDQNFHKPFFAWIQLMPPHEPYLPPEPYMGIFNSSPRARSYKSSGASVETSVEIRRARYDELIRYCDSQFESFIGRLRNKNMLNNTVIILSADHGESFEHDYFGHRGPHLYEQVTHIPLIIKEPGQTSGVIIKDIVKQLDIPSTILDLANIENPSWMEGLSLIPLIRGRKLPPAPLFAMNFEKNQSRGHKIKNGTIALWKGDYKLIYYFGTLWDKRKSSPSHDRLLLFNLKLDPSELYNLIDKKPDIGRCLLAIIEDDLKKTNERMRKNAVMRAHTNI